MGTGFSILPRVAKVLDLRGVKVFEVEKVAINSYFVTSKASEARIKGDC